MAFWANWCNSSVLWMGVWGQSSQSLGNFCNFFKKIITLTPLGSHFKRLEATEKNKIAEFKNLLKIPKLPAISALFNISRSNSNHVWTLAYVSMRVAWNSQSGGGGGGWFVDLEGGAQSSSKFLIFFGKNILILGLLIKNNAFWTWHRNLQCKQD